MPLGKIDEALNSVEISWDRSSDVGSDEQLSTEFGLVPVEAIRVVTNVTENDWNRKCYGEKTPTLRKELPFRDSLLEKMFYVNKFCVSGGDEFVYLGKNN